LRAGYIGELEIPDRVEARGRQAEIVDQVVGFARRKRERGLERRRELGVSGSMDIEPALSASRSEPT
jgi:hypothetical protein